MIVRYTVSEFLSAKGSFSSIDKVPLKTKVILGAQWLSGRVLDLWISYDNRKVIVQLSYYLHDLDPYIYLNAKVSQPFNICVFFSMDHVRIFI